MSDAPKTAAQVLIVDNDAELAESLGRLLADGPLITVIGVAHTGADALERARSTRPDIVLVSHQLPDMDGANLTRVLKAELPDVKVIALTGSNFPRAHRAMVDAGASAWVPRTGTVQELRGAVLGLYAAGETVRDDELPPDAGGLQAEDWFVDAVRKVSDAGRAACESVEAAVRALHVGRQARLAGRPMSEIVDELISSGGRDVRLGAARAFRQFEWAIQSMRAGVIRAMIDEEGLSVTEASARLGISRQAGTRLYRSEGHHPAGPPHRI